MENKNGNPILAIVIVIVFIIIACASCGSSSGSNSGGSSGGFVGSDGKYHEYIPEFGDDVNNWMEENW